MDHRELLDLTGLNRSSLSESIEAYMKAGLVKAMFLGKNKSYSVRKDRLIKMIKKSVPSFNPVEEDPFMFMLSPRKKNFLEFIQEIKDLRFGFDDISIKVGVARLKKRKIQLENELEKINKTLKNLKIKQEKYNTEDPVI